MLCMLVLVKSQEDRVRVETNYGPVEGLTFPLHTGRSINSFLAIPFAKPPVDELRWRAPEEPEPWTGL